MEVTDCRGKIVREPDARAYISHPVDAAADWSPGVALCWSTCDVLLSRSLSLLPFLSLALLGEPERQTTFTFEGYQEVPRDRESKVKREERGGSRGERERERDGERSRFVQQIPYFKGPR